MEPERMGEEMPEDEEKQSPGYSVVINCHGDGTHDVFRKTLEQVDESTNPDGLFGLRSLEDALRGVIAIKENNPEYESAQHSDMMREYDRP